MSRSARRVVSSTSIGRPSIGKLSIRGLLIASLGIAGSLATPPATGVAGGAPLAHASTAGDVARTTVFERGADGYHTFRIPAIVRTTTGTLLAFAEGRVNDPSDDGDIDLVLKRSTDGGRTWGPLQVIADDGPNKWGNPVPIVDETTGRIVLNTTRTGGDVTGNDVNCGRADAEQTRRSFIQISDDDGRTWSEPVDITADVRPDNWRHFVGGPGHGVQLTAGPHAGRLVIPGNHSVAPPEGSADECASVSGGHVLYSDDGGETWHLGGVDDHGSDEITRPNETTATELADGTVYFSSRDQGRSAGQRLDTTSSDGGASFDRPYAPVDGVVTSRIQGSLLRLPAGPGVRDRLLLSVPDHPTARENLTLWSSTDDGASWHRGIEVYHGPAGYSDLVALGGPPGNRFVGVLFENGERLYDETELSYHHRISFARVPERLLDNAAPPPPTTPDLSGHDYDGTISGSPTLVDGVHHRGLELAGDYVELPLRDELAFAERPFTAAAHFRTDHDATQTLFWAHSPLTSGHKWWIRLEPGSDRIRAHLNTGEVIRYVAAAGEFTDGEWHHVALTRSDDGIALYVDGVAAATGDPAAGSVSAEARTGIRVGARIDGINNPFVGSIDEVWLFDRALTPDEVAALAAHNTPPNDGTLVHLPFDRIQR